MQRIVATALAWIASPFLVVAVFIWACLALAYHGLRYVLFGETNWNWCEGERGQIECDVKFPHKWRNVPGAK